MGQPRRKLVLGGLAAVLLAAAVTLLLTRSRGRAQLPRRFVVRGVCLACRRDVEVSHAPRQTPPFVCPKCQRRAVYAWWYCRQCRRRFVPRLIPGRPGGPPRPLPFPVCTACGSSDVCGYDPTLPDQRPVGDAPLPKWP